LSQTGYPKWLAIDSSGSNLMMEIKAVDHRAAGVL